MGEEFNEVLAKAERSCELVNITQDRCACGAWEPPTTPGEWLAWFEDEIEMQLDRQDQWGPEPEWIMRATAICQRLRAMGITPAPLPWEEGYNHDEEGREEETREEETHESMAEAA